MRFEPVVPGYEFMVRVVRGANPPAAGDRLPAVSVNDTLRPSERSSILYRNCLLTKKVYVVGADSPSQEDIDKRVSLFTQALRERGLRLTHQRLEVAREIAGSNRHADVEEIYQRVRERVPTISLDTVYRTLGALERLGLIRRVEVLGGPARYDANLEHHHHFICTQCGLIRDVYAESYKHLQAPDSVTDLGRVDSITVQLRGLCRNCANSNDGGTPP